MEVDSKTIVTVLVAVLTGGGSGVITSEVRTQAALAEIRAQVAANSKVIDERVAEGKTENADIIAMIKDAETRISKRMDRIEDRQAR